MLDAKRADLRTARMAEATALRVPGWRWALAALVCSAAVALAAPSIDWSEVGHAFELTGSRPVTVALLTIAYATAFVLRAWAWRLWLDTKRPLRELVANLHVSLFLNHLLPLKAGEVSRPLLATKHGVPVAEAVSTTLVARLSDFVALALLALATVTAVREFGTVGLAVQGAMVCIAAAVVATLALRRGVPSKLPSAVRPRAEAVHRALRDIAIARLAAPLPLVVVSWALEAAVLLGAADLLGADMSLRVAIGATAFTILFQAVHFTPGGIGVYEAAMASVLVSQGVPAEQALSLAIVTHFLKFAYALSVGGACALGEGVFLLRGRREHGARRASRLEVVAARLWNGLNEGKPFTPVFAGAVILLLSLPHAGPSDYWARAAIAVAVTAPLALVFWRFAFPLRLRVALWAYLVLFIAITGSFNLLAAALVLALYLIFTVVLWGTIYYHLRIGTGWTNGVRFTRLVLENPDPTSGNFLEQVPKVGLLVLAFFHVVDGPSVASASLMLFFTCGVALSALLLHQWFFRWVPALPQPAVRLEAPKAAARPARKARRFIAIVIDGCRDDRLREAHTPVIDRLRAEGTDFAAMDTVYPARTVTCFSSMLTGAPPAVHGMRSNFVPSLGVKCDSAFDVLRRTGARGTLVGIAHLVDAFGERDVRTVTAVMDNDEIDDALIARGKQVLREEDPDLLVLQLLSVDQTGHARGSYNREYLEKIEETDQKIGGFLDWCRAEGFLEGARVLITADHGQGIGIGGHGHMTPTEIRIPCILWGAGVTTGAVVGEPRFITDIAATVCDSLGIEQPRQSVGRVLEVPAAHAQGPVVFIVPAHNEEANLPGVLAVIQRSGVRDVRIVVVDDGPTDATAAVARQAGATVISHEHNRGLGAALRTGLAVARGMRPRAAVYLDADGEYDAVDAAALLQPIQQGEADYVLGNRFRGRAQGMTLSRRVANRAFSALLSLLAGRWIGDGQTGFRAFSPRALEVAEIIHDYNYAQVLSLDLLKKGMRLREVPVSYRRRTNGRSFVRGEYLWRVPLGMVKEMLTE